MVKNEEIEVRPLENGFLVDHSWREDKINDKGIKDYDYINKKYMFSDWSSVTNWVSKNPLIQPPIV